jgi:hypothetical protein
MQAVGANRVLEVELGSDAQNARTKSAELAAITDAVEA